MGCIQRRLSRQQGALTAERPDHGGQALEIVNAVIHSGGCGLIVVDSVAALVPEAGGGLSHRHVAAQVQLMSQATRAGGRLRRGRGAQSLTHPLRQKSGVMFGDPETTTGGGALRSCAMTRQEPRPKLIAAAFGG